MPEASKMKVKFSVGGKPEISAPRQLTMRQVIAHIKGGGYNPELEEELISRISRYPANSLNTIVKNLTTMVAEATVKIRNRKQPITGEDHEGKEEIRQSRVESRPTRKKFEAEEEPESGD